MYARETDPFQLWQAQTKEAFEFWVSLWPVAPLFGVEWRFAEMVRPFVPAMDLGIYGSTNEKRGAAARPARKAPNETVVNTAVAEAVEVTVSAMPSEIAPAHGDLTRIKGIGPALEKQLNVLGITTLEQLASLSDVHVAALDAQLSAFKGRCSRDDWVGQARALVG